MRKAISTIVVACAFMAGAAGIADAAKSSVSNTKCGHTYTPACKKPHKKVPPKKVHKPQPPKKVHKPQPPKPKYVPPRIANKTPNPECVNTGISYKLPTITFTADSGLKSIKVLLGSRTIKTVSFKGKGPTKYSLTNLPVPTVDLLSGSHEVSVNVTDATKKSVHKTLNFSVCQAKPEFTG